MPFAQWLQSKMEQHGLSNYRIAKMAGVHQSTVANWLSGAKPQAEKEKLVRKAISDYEFSYNQHETSEPKKDTTLSGDVDARDMEFVELLSKLTDAEKDIILAQLRGIAQGR